MSSVKSSRSNEAWIALDESSFASNPQKEDSPTFLKVHLQPCDKIRELYTQTLPLITNMIPFQEEVLREEDKEGERTHAYFLFEMPSFPTLEERFTLDGVHQKDNFRYTNGATIDTVRWIFWQLLQPLRQLEEHSVIHGTIHPTKIYYDQSTHEVRLAPPDHALNNPASWEDAPENTSAFSAPELLLGKPAFDTSVDLWAITVVMVEIYLNTPLFRLDQGPKEDYNDTLYFLTFKIGMPTAPYLRDAEMGELFGYEAGNTQLQLLERPSVDVSSACLKYPGPMISDKGKDSGQTREAELLRDLVASILVYEDRPSLDEVLKHPFFTTH